MNKDERITKINNAVKNGFGKDWYYRAGIQKVHLITDDIIPLVILEVYNGELESVLMLSVPLSEFYEVLKF